MSTQRQISNNNAGFVKTGVTTPADRPQLSSEQKTTLIRKGNELFNEGQVDTAKRIFITVGYTDGLIRLGDHYYTQNRPLEAFKMYRLAPDNGRSERMIERMALVLRTWLLEDQAQEQRARTQ